MTLFCTIYMVPSRRLLINSSYASRTRTYYIPMVHRVAAEVSCTLVHVFSFFRNRSLWEVEGEKGTHFNFTDDCYSRTNDVSQVPRTCRKFVEKNFQNSRDLVVSFYYAQCCTTCPDVSFFRRGKIVVETLPFIIEKRNEKSVSLPTTMRSDEYFASFAHTCP